jgi:hypothetical protein
MHYKLLFNKNGIPTYGSQHVFNPKTYNSPKGKYVIIDYVSGTEGVPESELLNHTKKALETLPKDYSTNLLLSYHPEAIHSTHWINILELAKDYGYKKCIVYDGGLDLTVKVDGIELYHVMATSLIDIYTKPFITFPRDKLYCFLARKLRKHRVELLSEIYKNKLNFQGNITCGWSKEDMILYDNPDVVNAIPSNIRKILPITIDSEETWVGLTRLEPEMYRSVCHVVLESNVCPEWFKDHPLMETSSDRQFITEKTIKAFALGQIPIFVALPGYVDKLRNLGFDVFDDIVNHSYDLEKDFEIKSVLIAHQIRKLGLNYSIADWNTFLLENMDRLVKNFNRVNYITKHCITKFNALIHSKFQ